MTERKSFTLAEIAEFVGAQVIGDTQCVVSKLATLSSAQSGDIAFLASSKYANQLDNTKASAVILNEADAKNCPTNAIVCNNPYVAFAQIAQLLDSTPEPASGIAPSAVIATDVKLGSNVSIGANSVIETGVQLADNVVIGANCFIGKNAQLGENTKLWSNVSVYHDVVIGHDCLVQANTVIGSDGFGYANHGGKWIKIPQLGSVKIGNRVEIGASTTIDRGALDDTIIEDGVILDNQIQIAHNVVIGENTAMAACSVVAGSTTVGKNCSFAGLVGVTGHIDIVDNTVLTGRAMVTKSITEPGVYSSGMPIMNAKDWRKTVIRMRNLDVLNKRVSDLEKESDK